MTLDSLQAIVFYNAHTHTHTQVTSMTLDSLQAIIFYSSTGEEEEVRGGRRYLSCGLELTLR
jgi:hypothetical protein